MTHVPTALARFAAGAGLAALAFAAGALTAAHNPELLAGLRTPPPAAVPRPTPEDLSGRLAEQRRALARRHAELTQAVRETGLALRLVQARGDASAGELTGQLERQQAELAATAEALAEARRLEADLRAAHTTAEPAAALDPELRRQVRAWLIRRTLSAEHLPDE